jgi:outer membrane protein assembly factor BamA
VPAVTTDTDDFVLLGLENIKSTNADIGLAIVGDTVRFREFGAWHGKRFRLGVNLSPFATGNDDATYTNYTLDFRAYGKVTSRSLFAFRSTALITSGGSSTIFGIGGYNQIRGYQFREFTGDQAAWMNLEFRYPLVDELRFPFGSIRQIRGLVFFDIGAAWTQDGYFFDTEIGETDLFLINGVPGVFRDFKFWDSEEDTLRDGRASYGLGFSFYLGIFELNWTFAKNFPYMQTDRQSCQAAINALIGDLNATTDDLNNALSTCTFERVPGSNWKSDFYIGYAF